MVEHDFRESRTSYNQPLYDVDGFAEQVRAHLGFEYSSFWPAVRGFAAIL